ncbi:MAG: hypothetical protein IJI39_02965 [Clostridia bacterium]|nr:hypothetical protein [Clostridia bacterium]
MKRIISLIFTLAVMFGITAYAEPINADRLNDGAYDITVTSSSSMFRITNCVLNVKNGEMTAEMTLSGTGYEKLYMGKGSDAANAPDSEFIYYKEDADGKYTYTVPVAALDSETDCAAYSIRRQEWYDRTLVFESSSLPDGAVKKNLPVLWIVLGGAAVLAAAVIVLLVRRKKS